MLNLPIPKDDPLALYDAVVADRKGTRRNRLVALREQIACAYLRFYCHRDRLGRMRPLRRRIKADEADDLRYCYTKARLDNGTLTGLLLSSPRCAYCGVRDASTLDHYLAKDGQEGFPELSLLPVNLVPACAECNKPRGIRDRQTGDRALIHPYFDKVTQAQILNAVIRREEEGWGIEFRVDLTACPDPAFGQLYHGHVKLLSLLSRWRVKAMGVDGPLADIERVIRTWGRGKGRVEILSLLDETARERERRLGANHFESAVYRAAAACPAFVDHCSGALP